jgi:hypothetical protein
MIRFKLAQETGRPCLGCNCLQLIFIGRCLKSFSAAGVESAFRHFTGDYREFSKLYSVFHWLSNLHAMIGCKKPWYRTEALRC